MLYTMPEESVVAPKVTTEGNLYNYINKVDGKLNNFLRWKLWAEYILTVDISPSDQSKKRDCLQGKMLVLKQLESRKGAQNKPN